LDNESLIFACCSDLAGQVRGKAFPARQLEKRMRRGIGWTPTNVQITCFDNIAESPFGSLGDLLLIPDSNASVNVFYQDDLLPDRFIICDIKHTDGNPWECCTRSILDLALQRLQSVSQIKLSSAFEHEFQFRDVGRHLGSAFSFEGIRAQRKFGKTLVSTLNAAGLEPDTFLREYGPDQYEVTIAPQYGIKSADHAVILRELTRGTAERQGQSVSFTPLRDPNSVGNGVHIHMSFIDEHGNPTTYDPASATGLSDVAGSFVAGILKYLDSIVALTAPSVLSYKRLTPHRWSAAFNNLGFRDREAAVRICPVSELSDIKKSAQYNFEFRAADATASPYLQLAALVHAGTQGIEDALPTPLATEKDLSLLTDTELGNHGYIKLPANLENALDLLERNDTVKKWFPSSFIEIYLKHKRGELEYLKGKDEAEICAAYEQVY
jgi:glutamine synthetase